MTNQRTSRRESIGLQLAGYIVLAAVAVVGLLNAPSNAIRWVDAILLLAFGLIQSRSPQKDSPRWQAHLYLAVQTGLVAILMLLQPGWTLLPVLYFPLSVQAVLMLSLKQGMMWIAAFALLSVAILAIGTSWNDALLALLIYGGGYSFFGFFANILVRAENAQRESQALLQDLQEAHDQLQEYALRVEELAVVEERNRLAREMHDTLGHRLTVSAVQLEGAQRLCSRDQEQAAMMIGTVREQIREALAELRSTVAALRTPLEADLDLRSSLRRLTTHFEEATGLTVHRVLPNEMPPLPATHRLALYRAAQETLTNAQKHAGAQRVWLVLTPGKESITLLVSDDGHGFSIEDQKRGFGLRGLQERASQLAGELHVEPRPGGGTQVSLHLPLPKGSDEGSELDGGPADSMEDSNA